MAEDVIPAEPLFTEELPPDHRSGFVALVGKPNVGKSTLLNAWLGTKIAAVSPKPQTTRNALLGILTRPDAQIIFIDTPGIHRPRTKLGEYMVREAERAIPDADLVLFMVDASREPSEEDRQAAEVLAKRGETPTLLVLNKADLMSEVEREARRLAYEQLTSFDASLYISALMGHNLDRLLDELLQRLPLGPRFYPADQLTDQQERFVAAELIREQVLHFLQQEVPHAIAVGIHEFNERPNGVLYIAAYIYTERESQKGIVIGRGGQMLKRIGREARASLEASFGCRVYLELWVKVRKNWRRSERELRRLGYALR